MRKWVKEYWPYIIIAVIGALFVLGALGEGLSTEVPYGFFFRSHMYKCNYPIPYDFETDWNEGATYTIFNGQKGAILNMEYNRSHGITGFDKIGMVVWERKSETGVSGFYIVYMYYISITQERRNFHTTTKIYEDSPLLEKSMPSLNLIETKKVNMAKVQKFIKRVKRSK
jgi:hypothetical protein